MFQDIEFARNITIILVLIFLTIFILGQTKFKKKKIWHFLNFVIALTIVASHEYQIILGDTKYVKYDLVIWLILSGLAFFHFLLI